MKGGRRPPEPTPPDWFEDLPTFTAAEIVQDGNYIFVGTGVGQNSSITNPIMNVVGTSMGLMSATNSTSRVWRLLMPEEQLSSLGVNSTGLAQNIRDQIGWTGVGKSLMTNVALTRGSIIGKIYPLEQP